MQASQSMTEEIDLKKKQSCAKRMSKSELACLDRLEKAYGDQPHHKAYQRRTKTGVVSVQAKGTPAPTASSIPKEEHPAKIKELAAKFGDVEFQPDGAVHTTQEVATKFCEAGYEHFGKLSSGAHRTRASYLLDFLLKHEHESASPGVPEDHVNQTVKVGDTVRGGRMRIVSASPSQVTVSSTSSVEVGPKISGSYTYRWDGTGYKRQGEYLKKALKAGEGSHGGEVVGHTRSGKPIYGPSKAHYMRAASYVAADARAGRIGLFSSAQDHGKAHEGVQSALMACEDKENAHCSHADNIHEYTKVDHADAAKRHTELANHPLARSFEKLAHQRLAQAHAKRGVRKSVTNKEQELLEKAVKRGEGSRGGRIAGHTKSGKPIYQPSSDIKWMSKQVRKLQAAARKLESQSDAMYRKADADDTGAAAAKYDRAYHLNSQAGDASVEADGHLADIMRAVEKEYRQHSEKHDFSLKDHHDNRIAHTKAANSSWKGSGDHGTAHDAISDECKAYIRDIEAEKRYTDGLVGQIKSAYRSKKKPRVIKSTEAEQACLDRLLQKSDIDVDVGTFGIANYTAEPGQVAMRVKPNEKCNGCGHYSKDQVACLVGLVPAACGDGSYPELGYDPVVPNRIASKNWVARNAGAVVNTTPPGAPHPAGEVPYRVDVLGDSALALSLSEQVTLVKAAVKDPGALAGHIWHHVAGPKARAKYEKEGCSSSKREHKEGKGRPPKEFVEHIRAGMSKADTFFAEAISDMTGVPVVPAMTADLSKSLTITSFADALGTSEDVVRSIARRCGDKDKFASFVKSRLPDIRIAHSLTESDIESLYNATQRTLKSLSPTAWETWKGVNFEGSVSDEALARAIATHGLLDVNGIQHGGIVAPADPVMALAPAEPIQTPQQDPVASFVGGNLHLADVINRVR